MGAFQNGKWGRCARPLARPKTKKSRGKDEKRRKEQIAGGEPPPALPSNRRRASEEWPGLSCLRRACGRQAPRRGGSKGRPAPLLGPPSTQRRVRPLWRAELHRLRTEN